VASGVQHPSLQIPCKDYSTCSGAGLRAGLVEHTRGYLTTESGHHIARIVWRFLYAEQSSRSRPLLLIVKIACTTVGETAADYLSFELRFGLPVTTLLMTGLLIVA
jgi:hypothetical protein